VVVHVNSALDGDDKAGAKVLQGVHDKVTSIHLSASLFNFVLSGFWSTICKIARTRGSDNENVRN
jgi:hypothetical protein